MAISGTIIDGVFVPDGQGPRGPAGTSGSLAYDIGGFIPGQMPSSLPTTIIVFASRFTRDVTFPADFASSVAGGETASTSVMEFVIKKNTTAIGGMTFSVSDEAVFNTGGLEIDFAPGDRLIIEAPVGGDGDLTDVSFTFKGQEVI